MLRLHIVHSESLISSAVLEGFWFVWLAAIIFFPALFLVLFYLQK
jgi:hypothetical protein